MSDIVTGQPIALYPPDPQVKIRPVLASDVLALCRFWPERTEAQVQQLVSRVQQQAQQGRGLGVVVVDEDGRSLLGYGQMTLWYDTAEIADLVIADGHRNHGLGTTLIQYLVRAAREMHAVRVEIGAALSNSGAVVLYRRLGFQHAQTVMIDLGQGEEQVMYMWLNLK